MTSADILKALNVRFSTHEHVLNNVFIMGGWESDFFSLSKEGYAYEIEVKISKSDFRADFQKEDKHKILSAFKKGIVTLGNPRVFNWGWTNGSVNEYINAQCCHIHTVDFSKTHLPNRFFYACPKGLISEFDIPAYAGLIYINELRECTTVKPAPLLHKNKHCFDKKLLDKYYWKYRNLQSEFDVLKHQYHKLEKQLLTRNDQAS